MTAENKTFTFVLTDAEGKEATRIDASSYVLSGYFLDVERPVHLTTIRNIQDDEHLFNAVGRMLYHYFVTSLGDHNYTTDEKLLGLNDLLHVVENKAIMLLDQSDYQGTPTAKNDFYQVAIFDGEEKLLEYKLDGFLFFGTIDNGMQGFGLGRLKDVPLQVVDDGFSYIAKHVTAEIGRSKHERMEMISFFMKKIREVSHRLLFNNEEQNSVSTTKKE